MKAKHTWHFNRVKIKSEDSMMTLYLPFFSTSVLWFSNFFPTPGFFLKLVSILIFVFNSCLFFFLFYNFLELLFSFIVPYSVSLHYDLHNLFQSLIYFSRLLVSLNVKLSQDFQCLRSGLELQNLNPNLKLAKVQNIQTWEERGI